MIVSWDWLKQYVALDMSVEDLEYRLMMSGLNHEGTERIEGDPAIDLEVTSNRADCLGHIGVAREISVLYDMPMTLPAANPTEGSTAVDSLTSVTLEAPEMCPRYTARVIRGVKVAPSPDWMVARLRSLGVASVNNVVDITNYVMLECGQPLHAFDFAKLSGQEIVVRAAKKGEKFEAINHKEYELSPTDCVIADAERPVAVAGVMGGADSEVTESTTDLLIESAAFNPLVVRTTARRLTLHSDSSFRFERSPDPESVDWASRRCCELILELAGGELASGMVDVGSQPGDREPVTLRFDQVERVLGIPVAAETSRSILEALGNEVMAADDTSVTIVPPSWRSDLTREIDLIEEVGRINGYDKIPEDSQVPMAASHRRDEDRVVAKIYEVLVGSGFDEAMTMSVVDDVASEAFSPWSDAEPLRTSTSLARGAVRLRRSVVPSLLAARRLNESLGNDPIELFEVAKVYLPQGDGLPVEEKVLSMTSGEDFFDLKGRIEMLLSEICPDKPLEITTRRCGEDFGLLGSESAELKLGGESFGYLGTIDPKVGKKAFDLRGPATVAELRIAPLLKNAVLIPHFQPTSSYPAVDRDLNFEVAQDVRWSELADTVRGSAGPLLENVQYRETYRDAERLGADKKSLVFRLILRRSDGTLTSEEADAVRQQVELACGKAHDAKLRS